MSFPLFSSFDNVFGWNFEAFDQCFVLLVVSLKLPTIEEQVDVVCLD